MPTRRRRLGGDVCAIFVHAGAGYHSLQNEKVHLQACEDAAKCAMVFLNAGGDAADAVEMAIKVLEDKEITNAGYGSNLAIDGTVECDATVVDHFGRSGAVGAVGQIRNPIHLARVILDHSTKPLSLRRVPPNLLVGQGAVDFAFDAGIPVLPNDALTSAGAHERWLRWKSDLQKLIDMQEDDSGPPGELIERKLEGREGQRQREAQTRLLAACWNESQPYSPALTPSGSSDPTDIFGTSAPIELRALSPRPTSEKSDVVSGSPPAGQKKAEKTPGSKHVSWPHRKQNNDGQGYTSYGNDNDDDDDKSLIDSNPELGNLPRHYQKHHQANKHADLDLPELSADGSRSTPDLPRNLAATRLKPPPENVRADEITDTVGAIAIDCLGNIAAGSSSGGIGMKHKGRVGPAALVGIGTAVVPIDPDDPLKTSCATVTSGTGEHMATTMAAMTCANRIYSCERKGKEGSLESTDGNSAMYSFVQKDFMGHPSVANSHSAGAIGVLALKKTKDGVWLYWGHNTDSFAVASMSSEDSKPKSLMSRNKGDYKIVTGGRSIKHHRVSNWPGHSFWPTNPVEALDPGSSPEQPAPKRQKTKRVPTKYVYDYQAADAPVKNTAAAK